MQRKGIQEIKVLPFVEIAICWLGVGLLLSTVLKFLWLLAECPLENSITGSLPCFPCADVANREGPIRICRPCHMTVLGGSSQNFLIALALHFRHRQMEVNDRKKTKKKLCQSDHPRPHTENLKKKL